MKRASCMGVCYRIRHVLWRMPYSIFDLSAGVGVTAVGIYLLSVPGLFDLFAGVYVPMSAYANQYTWGLLFTAMGALAIVVVLWPHRPPFYVRLFARMCVAFCLTAAALNNLANNPPPASGIFYAVLTLFALWSVLRTRCDG